MPEPFRPAAWGVWALTCPMPLRHPTVFVMSWTPSVSPSSRKSTTYLRTPPAAVGERSTVSRPSSPAIVSRPSRVVQYRSLPAPPKANAPSPQTLPACDRSPHRDTRRAWWPQPLSGSNRSTRCSDTWRNLQRAEILGEFRHSPHALSWRLPPQSSRLPLRTQVKFTQARNGMCQESTGRAHPSDKTRFANLHIHLERFRSPGADSSRHRFDDNAGFASRRPHPSPA